MTHVCCRATSCQRKLSNLTLILGLSAFLCLPYAVFFSDALGGFGRLKGGDDLLWVVTSLTMCIGFAIALIARKRILPLLCEKRVLICVSVILAGCYGLMAVLGNAPAWDIRSVGAFILSGCTGLICGHLFIVWPIAIALQNDLRGTDDIVVATAYFIAMLFSVLVYLIPNWVASLLAVLLPLISLWGLLKSGVGKADCLQANYVDGCNSLFLNIVMAVGLFVLWVCMNYVESASNDFRTGLVALAVAIPSTFMVTIACLWLVGLIAYDTGMRLSIPIVSAGLIILLLNSGGGLLAYALAFAGMMLMNVFVWVICVNYARKSLMQGLLGVAILRGAITLATFAEKSTHSILITEMHTSLLLLFALIIVAVTIVPYASRNSTRCNGPDDNRLNEPISSPKFVIAVNKKLPLSCFSRFELTEREWDVFLLLSRGRNASYIKDALGVSRNTINSHISHIYRKLDVHSHQELIDLVENIAMEEAGKTDKVVEDSKKGT